MLSAPRRGIVPSFLVFLIVALLVALLQPVLATPASAQSAPATGTMSPSPHFKKKYLPDPTGKPTAHKSVPACPAPTRAGQLTCNAYVRSDVKVSPAILAVADEAPAGFSPSDLRSAYNLGSATSGGRTVAIVDAYDDFTAEADLAAYRSEYGLSACTSANGCFTRIDQRGGTSYPNADP